MEPDKSINVEGGTLHFMRHGSRHDTSARPCKHLLRRSGQPHSLARSMTGRIFSPFRNTFGNDCPRPTDYGALQVSRQAIRGACVPDAQASRRGRLLHRV